MSKAYRILSWSLLVVMVPVLASAGQVNVPNVFTNGQVADADAVNQNFSALEAAIDDNDTRLQAVEGTHTIRVAAVVGDTAASGAALLAAVASVPASASAQFPARILVGPGTFDLGTTTLALPSPVLLEGVEGHTTLTSQAAIAVSASGGGPQKTIRTLTISHRPPGAATTVSTDGFLTLQRVAFDAVAMGTLSVVQKTMAGVVRVEDCSAFVSGAAAPGTAELRFYSGSGGQLELRGGSLSVVQGTAGLARVVDLTGGTATIQGTELRVVGAGAALRASAGTLFARRCISGFNSIDKVGSASVTLLACELDNVTFTGTGFNGGANYDLGGNVVPLP